MVKRRRRVSPEKARAAIMGEVALRGIYSRPPAPAKTTCSRGRGEAGGLGLLGGLCLKCRLKDRNAERQEKTAEAGTEGPF